MRGRLKAFGFTYPDPLITLSRIMEREGDLSEDVINQWAKEHESRYTEDMSEWIEWQKPKEVLSE